MSGSSSSDALTDLVKGIPTFVLPVVATLVSWNILSPYNFQLLSDSHPLPTKLFFSSIILLFCFSIASILCKRHGLLSESSFFEHSTLVLLVISFAALLWVIHLWMLMLFCSTSLLIPLFIFRTRVSSWVAKKGTQIGAILNAKLASIVVVAQSQIVPSLPS